MKKTLALLISVISAIIFCSCAPKMMFGTSTITPGAEGSAKVTTNKNRNYVLSVKVINLTEPQRLTPSKSVYVVWFETEGNEARNIGMIKVSTGLFSKTYKGEFKTICVTKPTKVFITAEDSGNVQYPGPQVVLKTE